jgi:hypothetical protein
MDVEDDTACCGQPYSHFDLQRALRVLSGMPVIYVAHSKGRYDCV